MFAVLALVLSQNLVPAGIDGPIYASGRPLAFFEFAPASGAGLGAPCACAAVTGAKGETVTWTRASSAMCTKSASESAIANGDLVLCGNNLPRVMSLGGPLGVLVESSRQNTTIRSQEFNDAAYVDSFSVVAAPTLNGADSAAAPDGTLTADAYTFPATTGAQHSSRAQAAGCPGAGAIVGSVYVKGQSGSGSLDLCANTTGCATCNYTNTAWTRCVAPSAGGTTAWYVGNMSAFNGSIARASNAVYLWGAQCEAGAYATSYIPTAGSAAIRSADTATVPSSVVTSAGFSMAATLTPLRQTAGSDQVWTSLYASDTARFHLGATSGTVNTYATAVSGVTVTPATQAGVNGATERLAFDWDGTTGLTFWRNGVSTTATGALTNFTATNIGIGSVGATIPNRPDSIVALVCQDPSRTRCR